MKGHTIGKRGCEQDAQVLGDVARQVLGDESIGAERQVRPVLLQRPHGKEKARVAGQNPAHLEPGQVLQQI